MGVDSGPASADGVGSRANSGANSASADGGRTDEKGGKRSESSKGSEGSASRRGGTRGSNMDRGRRRSRSPSRDREGRRGRSRSSKSSSSSSSDRKRGRPRPESTQGGEMGDEEYDAFRRDAKRQCMRDVRQRQSQAPVAVAGEEAR